MLQQKYNVFEEQDCTENGLFILITHSAYSSLLFPQIY